MLPEIFSRHLFPACPALSNWSIGVVLAGPRKLLRFLVRSICPQLCYFRQVLPHDVQKGNSHCFFRPSCVLYLNLLYLRSLQTCLYLFPYLCSYLVSTLKESNFRCVYYWYSILYVITSFCMSYISFLSNKNQVGDLVGNQVGTGLKGPNNCLPAQLANFIPSLSS